MRSVRRCDPSISTRPVHRPSRRSQRTMSCSVSPIAPSDRSDPRPDQSQYQARADAGGEGGVIYDSTVAMWQGLFPATGSSTITLANGTTVTSPLGGYVRPALCATRADGPAIRAHRVGRARERYQHGGLDELQRVRRGQRGHLCVVRLDEQGRVRRAGVRIAARSRRLAQRLFDQASPEVVSVADPSSAYNVFDYVHVNCASPRSNKPR